MAHQHVVQRGDQWGVLGEGNSRTSGNFDTQQQAFERAREIARNQSSDVIIHGENGRIRDRLSYGNDPFPPKG